MAKTLIEPGSPRAFATRAELRAWLERHHRLERELTVLLYRKGTGRPGITWPELVDELLCFGWIDGVRKSAGPEAYTIRVTPRRTPSRWSVVNVRRALELIELGRMEPAGRAAFEARGEGGASAYSYEERPAWLAPEYETMLRSNEAAWAYFRSEAPYYRRLAAHYVMSAKREETRKRRIERLIRDSASGSRIGILGQRSEKRGRGTS